MPPSDPPPCLELLVLGSGTGVGKTRLTSLAVQGLRGLGRSVWVHKPVACGDWDGRTAEDGRLLEALCGDGQPKPLVCPLQFPLAASPARSARLAGQLVTPAMLRRALMACQGPHDLVVESAGGLLSPLCTTGEGISEVVAGLGLLTVVVCTPELGTINATALTVREARRAGLAVRGLILNHARPVQDTPAERHAAEDLAAACGVPILHCIAHGPQTAQAEFPNPPADAAGVARSQGLAHALLAAAASGQG